MPSARAPRRRVDALERALLRAVDEMIDGFAVGEETWATLAASFDGAQMLELLFVIGDTSVSPTS